MSVATRTTWDAATGGRTMLKSAATLHRLLYCASGGRTGRTLHGASVLLLTTMGQRTGRGRMCPLCYLTAGDDLSPIVVLRPALPPMISRRLR